MGFRVRCLVRARSSIGWLKDLPVEILTADFSHVPSLTQSLRGADFVVHVAGTTRGKRRSDFFRGNVEVTSHLLEAAAIAGGIKKFCAISSLTAVGPSPDGTPVDEESPCHPITAYGESKLEAERACRRYLDRLPTVILRPPAVYGPRDKDILHMFRWINLRLMPVLGSRHKTLSLIYVTELARMIAQVSLSEKTTGKTYFVGDEERYVYSDLVDIAASLLGKRAHRIPFPRVLVYAIAAATQATSWVLPRPSVVNIDKAKDLLTQHWVCDSRKIREELGLTTMIQAKEGLRLTLEWYRKHGWLSP